MRVSLLAIAITAAIALRHGPSRGREPYDVTIISRDYGFDAPDSIPPGVTTLRLENHGPHQHHLAVVRLDSGHTLQDFRTALAGHDRLPRWITFLGGPNAPPPGGTAIATLDLEPGHYLLTCLVSTIDASSRKMVAHAMRGMVHPLTVSGTSQSTVFPPSDATVTLIDYGFTLSHPLVAGKQTIRIRNVATQPHEVVLGKLPPGKTAHDLVDWIDTQQGDAPLIPVGGLTPIEPDGDAEIIVDLAPGDYGLWCFVPDAHDGAMHVMHGMVRQITVGPPPPDARTAAGPGAGRN